MIIIALLFIALIFFLGLLAHVMHKKWKINELLMALALGIILQLIPGTQTLMMLTQEATMILLSIFVFIYFTHLRFQKTNSHILGIILIRTVILSIIVILALMIIQPLPIFIALPSALALAFLLTSREDYPLQGVISIFALFTLMVFVTNTLQGGIASSIPIVGIPGFPVSALLAMEEFVMPVIRHTLGLNIIQREKIKAVITQKIASRLGMEEFIRVGVGYFPERETAFVAVPQRKGAGIITSMVKADGILRIPRLCEGLEDNSIVEVELLKSRQQIESNIILIGSHDNMLDILSDCLTIEHPQMSLCATNVGSLGGLLALRRGDCHLTTSHLLDKDTGTYNLPYIKRFLPDMDVSVITIAWREQGLIVKEGNPKNIHGLKDLIRDDVVFVNRQKGAGTRILLDYELNEAGISSSNIRGYEIEVFTHMAVCASIDAGTADVGLGIMASADVFGMDFVPIARERYDMIIPRKNLSLPGISALLEAINSSEFYSRAALLKGYDLNECGHQIVCKL